MIVITKAKTNMAKDEELKKVAEALFVGASENDSIDPYYNQMKFFTWILHGNKEYFEFLTSAIVSYNEKVQSVDEVLGGAFEESFMDFVKLMINKGYIKDIFTIRDIFFELIDRSNNVLTGIVYSPFELDKKQLLRMQEVFTKKLGKTVNLKFDLDPSLIVGVKVVIGETVYELTGLSQLENAKRNIVNNIIKQDIKEDE